MLLAAAQVEDVEIEVGAAAGVGERRRARVSAMAVVAASTGGADFGVGAGSLAGAVTPAARLGRGTRALSHTGACPKLARIRILDGDGRGLSARWQSGVCAAQIAAAPAPPSMPDSAAPAPGYHRYNGREHVWVGGHWELRRDGFEYAGPRWVNRVGRFEYLPGRWVRRI